MHAVGLRGPDPRAPRVGAPSYEDLVSALRTASRVLVGVSARSVADVEDTVTLTRFRTIVERVTRCRRTAISRIAASMPSEQRGALVEAFAAFSTAAGEPGALADEPSRLGW